MSTYTNGKEEVKDIYQRITDRMVEELKKGHVPWQRPWVQAMNLVSMKPYRGINTFTIALEEKESPFWMTYKQAVELGGTVKRGEKSTQVIYWNFKDMVDQKTGVPILGKNGKPRQIPFIRWANVFNLDQVKDIKAPELEKNTDTRMPLEKAQEILEKANVCQMRLNGQMDRAVYMPALDAIEVPSIKKFRNGADFYHTVFHELTHATGHASRLDREGITQPIVFGSERYAKEELIAELGASFLSNDAGILGECEFKNSTAYLQSWVKALESNPKWITAACTSAQKACQYIQGEREITKSPREEFEALMAGADADKQKQPQNEYERE